MLIVRMMGNLGNQLFIYAMARSIQLESNEKMIIDLSSLRRHYYTASYKLNKYNLPSNIVTTNLKELPFKSRLFLLFSSSIFHVEQKIQRSLSKNKTMSNKLCKRWNKRGCFYNFNRFFYAFDAHKKKNTYLYGYFQSPKYFDKYRSIIIQDLSLKESLSDSEKKLIKDIENCESVGVSIRTIYDKHGDSFIKKDYYLRAIEKMKEIVPNAKFYIFSDSIENAKLLNLPEESIFVNQPESTHQLNILSKCKHFILANSTFSWWGAYICCNPNKMVIMPFPWDKQGKYREDIYFDGAIRLDCKFEK